MNNYIKNIENEILADNPEAHKYLNDINQELAESAFRNTSFSPEKRGVGVRIEYAEALLADKKELLEGIINASKREADVRQDYDVIVEEWFKSHREKVKAHYEAWLYSHMRVASSFIVGPANFPVARNEKLSRYSDAKLDAIGEFRKKSLKNILRFILPHGDGSTIKTDDPKATNKIESKIEELEKQREEMKAINKVVRKYFKNGDREISKEKSEEFGRIMRDKFDMSTQDIITIAQPNYMGRVVGFEKWQLQNLGANINRYKKRVKEVEATQAVSIDHEFANGIRVSISDDQKICIHFGFKPDDETRALLKSKAFKFSRNRDKAWVRKLTSNAKFSYEHYVKPKLESLA